MDGGIEEGDWSIEEENTSVWPPSTCVAHDKAMSSLALFALVPDAWTLINDAHDQPLHWPLPALYHNNWVGGPL